jgi:uncharacterized iron-regulated membrane protein
MVETGAARKPPRHWLELWVHKPRQTFLRRAFFQIHLWTGVVVALYICAIGISGSILVFKDELMPRPHLSSPLQSTESCTPATLFAALRAAESAYTGSKASLATCPTNANAFYQVNVRSPEPSSFTAYVEAGSDRVAGAIDQNAAWIGWVDRFHTDLLLKNYGRIWNGWGGVILVVLVVTGTVIWWPGIRHWSRGFRVDFRCNWKRINFDLHSAIGVWTIAFSFIWGLTAVYFAWEAPFERAVRLLSPITTAVYPSAEIDQFEHRAVPTAKNPLDLASVLRIAVATVPRAQLEGLFFGSGKAPILTVYMANGQRGDYANTDFLYFDQITGDLLLVWHRGENHTLGDWVIWLAVPLHFGTSFGMIGKVAWAGIGLAFPVLVITGMLMYWNRWLSKQFVIPGRAHRRAQY